MALRELASQIRKNRPLSELERLEHQLRRAIERQEFERAAHLRDRMRGLRKQTSVSPSLGLGENAVGFFERFFGPDVVPEAGDFPGIDRGARVEPLDEAAGLVGLLPSAMYCRMSGSVGLG